MICQRRDQAGIMESLRVDHHFFKACGHNGLGGFNILYAPAIRERHKALIGDLLQDLHIGRPVLNGSPDIQKTQFIHFQLIKDADGIDRIPDIRRVLKFNRFDKAIADQLKAGDNSGFKHYNREKFSSSFIPNL